MLFRITGQTTPALSLHIKTLWQHRQSLEKQQKAIQTQTGILSRQIGEAKRNKQPTDKLIVFMQAASAEQKTLSKQIKRINQDILNHFSEYTDKYWSNNVWTATPYQ